ncbi:anti-sigma regulatory factor (Ser/Thr protein kinase) [Nocardioides ginsengisegetis]|uniref:Anti-sigma regulatory factor (Ser/Thr protein kinase) n=1 Tax=Nocardioides ginsengisegetis TaxID=661491 RepID=A0A7W3J3A2_9ACTN|nr:ATP-binding protein [Nocardioides ginsengisegetis]MBA8805429.1 anti-sigma regulatory factor (Ser/Thr protein kinase) [Nocardioides ginsengisegetis]
MPAARWSYDLELHPQPQSVAGARRFVSDHLVDHDLPHLVDDVRLVVSELATNALLHAGTSFGILLWARGGLVVLEVRDGSPDGPSLGAAADTDTNGRGIALVGALSRDWGVTDYVDGAKSVWASFDG